MFKLSLPSDFVEFHCDNEKIVKISGRYKKLIFLKEKLAFERKISSISYRKQNE
jgi:hypothetical protein